MKKCNKILYSKGVGMTVEKIVRCGDKYKGFKRYCDECSEIHGKQNKEENLKVFNH